MAQQKVAELPDANLIARVKAGDEAALPPEYQAVLVLRDLEGLTTQEVAAVLGTTLLAITSRLHRARLALRERLAAHVEAGGGRV